MVYMTRYKVAICKLLIKMERLTIFVFLFPCPFFFPFRFIGKRQTPKEVKLGRGGGVGM